MRVALNLQLQEQVFLSAAAMDAASSARLDELIGVSGTLDQNSITLAEVVGSVKGQATAEALLDAWRGLVADLILYAQGQQPVASADIARRRSVIAAQLSFPGLPPATADELLRTYIQAQLALADAIVSHDASQADQRLRSAAAASDALARPLAAAISARSPAEAPPPTEGLDIDTRIGLTRLLHEHVYLSGAAVDAAADSRTGDAQAFLKAADGNALDLGTQLGAVYGPELGNGVTDRLRAETAALVSVASGGDRASSRRGPDSNSWRARQTAVVRQSALTARPGGPAAPRQRSAAAHRRRRLCRPRFRHGLHPPPRVSAPEPESRRLSSPEHRRPLSRPLLRPADAHSVDPKARTSAPTASF